ncbi:hypothetical protein FOZ61_004847 [Perkinsus olseni]|uniref:CS domain-containing protein n=1 Tax=Perkinsus olseni TaxID=32597 RepID=A0A7J6LVL8_PEROL|nr:hypothetical protein FOZ61_004847 [Perkinsus olseni]KAF4663339.1 hypothetical protein FOL46_004807 [Perkinsus olseni]
MSSSATSTSESQKAESPFKAVPVGSSSTSGEESDEMKRSDSKLRKSLTEKGDKSYYYAHSRDFYVPPDAKVVTGPGLITGGQPELIARSPSPEPRNVMKKRPVKQYSWFDDEEKVKVYTEDPQLLTALEDDSVEAHSRFTATGFDLWADTADGWRVILSVPTLNAEIVPEECKHRVSRGKRVSVTLKKKNVHRTWYNLKSTSD